MSSLNNSITQDIWNDVVTNLPNSIATKADVDDVLMRITEAGDWADLQLHEGYPAYVKSGSNNFFFNQTLTRNDITEFVEVLAGGEEGVYSDICARKMLDTAYKIISEDRYTEFRFRIHSIACESGDGGQGVRVSIRSLKQDIPKIQDVGLTPEEVAELFPTSGAVFVSGETGSGKTTTLAAAIAEIIRSSTKSRTILEFAQPIEYSYRSVLFDSPKRVVHAIQHDVPRDVIDFVDSVRSSLRSNGDSIYIGEMREYETIDAALALAQTGHHLLATLHTSSPVDAFGRIANVFDDSQKPRVYMELSSVVKTLMNQRLWPKKGGGKIAIRAWLTIDSKLKRKLLNSKMDAIPAVLLDAYYEQGRTFSNDARSKFDADLITEETYKQIVNDETNDLETAA